jgi:hypothetical protein
VRRRADVGLRTPKSKGTSMIPMELIRNSGRRAQVGCVLSEAAVLLPALAAVLALLCSGGCAQLTQLTDWPGLCGGGASAGGRRVPIPPTVKDFESPGTAEGGTDEHAQDQTAVER